MRVDLYREWNWEFDFGVERIKSVEESPNKYAIAYYDNKERLFRVDCVIEGQVSRYDYFCNERGRVIQKRALNDDGSVFIIVDLEYDDQREIVTEVGWCPGDPTCKSYHRPMAKHDE